MEIRRVHDLRGNADRLVPLVGAPPRVRTISAHPAPVEPSGPRLNLPVDRRDLYAADAYRAARAVGMVALWHDLGAGAHRDRGEDVGVEVTTPGGGSVVSPDGLVDHRGDQAAPCGGTA